MNIQQGSYPCAIEHPDGPRVAAQLELSAGRDPHGEVFGWPLEPHDGVIAVPQPAEHFSVLRGYLRVGLDVLLLDASVEPWFPERAHLRANLAVVGHVSDSNDDLRLSEASAQVTNGHRLFDTVPLNRITWPSQAPHTGKV